MMCQMILNLTLRIIIWFQMKFTKLFVALRYVLMTYVKTCW